MVVGWMIKGRAGPLSWRLEVPDFSCSGSGAADGVARCNAMLLAGAGASLHA